MFQLNVTMPWAWRMVAFQMETYQPALPMTRAALVPNTEGKKSCLSY